MGDTIFYACGFNDEEPYNSILKDERIKAVNVAIEDFLKMESKDENCVFFIEGSTFTSNLLDFLFFFSKKYKKKPVVVVGENYNQTYMEELFDRRPFTYVKLPSQKEEILQALLNAQNGKCNYVPQRNYAKELHMARLNLVALHDVGIALTAEKNLDKLLDLILTRIRDLAAADAGSLYLVEGGKFLRFKLSQNISLDWSCKQNALMPINKKSIGGYTAEEKKTVNLLDAYIIPPAFSFTFNKSYDISSGYRTKSMLTVPMCNTEGEVLGVIQLINKRKDYENKIPGKKLEEGEIIPFDDRDVELLTGLASQAAIALENAKLYHDIRILFEGFVKASIVAIEAKDPCTQGHSERVALLTVALAKVINKVQEGPFAKVSFSPKQILQLRYASLLHDFGKVSIREELLTKAKKLLPHELENLKARYKYIAKSIEADYYKECLDYVMNNGVEKFSLLKPGMDANLNERLKELEDTLELLIKTNEPAVLEESSSLRLTELSHSSYVDCNGLETPYLTAHEASELAIKRGSLSESERLEIESHVRFSYNFLAKIPWTKDLSRVPEIAYAHHEKLNGRGYPNHIIAEEIPLESQIMSVADIFDALTAQDRPYKPAVPLQKALEILHIDAKNNGINKDLVDLFESQKVYKCLDTMNL